MGEPLHVVRNLLMCVDPRPMITQAAPPHAGLVMTVAHIEGADGRGFVRIAWSRGRPGWTRRR